MTDGPIVYVVDDEEDVRTAIAWLLESVQLTTRTFNSAGAFLEHYQPGKVGCLVLDVRMPGKSGLELQQQLKEMRDDLPIIFLSAHGDIPMATRAMSEGAFQFIPKPSNNQQLLDTVHAALKESRERVHNARRTHAVFERVQSLTDREREICRFVVDGLSSKEIAERLEISTRTVEVHRAHIMQKMEAHSMADLLRDILKSGISL